MSPVCVSITLTFNQQKTTFPLPYYPTVGDALDWLSQHYGSTLAWDISRRSRLWHVPRLTQICITDTSGTTRDVPAHILSDTPLLPDDHVEITFQI